MDNPSLPVEDIPRIGSIFGPGGLVDTLFEEQQQLELTSETTESMCGVGTSSPIKDDSYSVSRNKRKLAPENEIASDFEIEANNCGPKIIKVDIDSDIESSEIGTGQEISVEESLFSNHLLLKIIFRHSNFQDLKSCRQVNRVWNKEATEILRNKFPMEPIVVSHSAVKLLNYEKFSNKMPQRSVTLEQFTDLVEKSAIFPCTNFALLDVPLNDSVYTFFDVNGCLIKSLEFRAGYNFAKDKATAFEILILSAKRLPNLETLSFQGDLYLSLVSPYSVCETLELKKLTSLNLHCKIQKYFLSRLLKMGKCLQDIYWNIELPNYSSGLNVFLDLNAITLLKNVHLNFQADSVELYEQVLQQKPRFRKIETVRFQQSLSSADLARVGRILTKLFYECSCTLTSISEMFSIGHIPCLQLPVFPNVVILSVFHFESVLDNPPVAVPLFPSNVNLAETFPNLKIFKLHFSDFEELTQFQVFEGQLSPLLTVQCLKITGEEVSCIPEIWVNQFCKLFPNVTSATFPPISETCCELIWNLSCLETLELAIVVDVNSFPVLDSIFTGFAQETVLDLYGRLPTYLDLSESDLEALRVKLSIVNLKHLADYRLSLYTFSELRHLTVEIIDQKTFDGSWIAFDEDPTFTCESLGASGDVLVVNDSVLLSHLTRKFGFQLCPKLESDVIIQFADETYTIPV